VKSSILVRLALLVPLAILPFSGYGSGYYDHRDGCSHQDRVLAGAATGALIGGALIEQSSEGRYRDREYRRPPPRYYDRRDDRPYYAPPARQICRNPYGEEYYCR